jgi:hypothetical protein
MPHTNPNYLEEFRDTINRAFDSLNALAHEHTTEINGLTGCVFTCLDRISQEADQLYEISEIFEFYSTRCGEISDHVFEVAERASDFVDEIEGLELPQGDIAHYLGRCQLCGAPIYDTDSFTQDEAGDYLCFECSYEEDNDDTDPDEVTDEEYNDGPKNAGAPSPVGND